MTQTKWLVMGCAALMLVGCSDKEQHTGVIVKTYAAYQPSEKHTHFGFRTVVVLPDHTRGVVNGDLGEAGDSIRVYFGDYGMTVDH